MDSTTRGLLIVLAVLVVVALAFSALTGGMMGPGFAGQGPLGPGMMQGRWGVLIVGLALLARAVGVGRGPHSTPLDVLKRRYAAGQITREQYEQIRKDLEQ
jgi:putative membrane protein